ncbi:MAG: EAL domain-containing protein [Alphaproteobacteria bacterium]|nr:EAL domain-containing protein [Alphaproteobacteria bacterium]
MFSRFIARKRKGRTIRILKHILLASSYALLAIAVGLVSPELVPELAPPASWLAGAVVFVAGLVVHESHVRHEQFAEALGHVLILGSDDEDRRGEIESLRRAIAEIGENLEAIEEGGTKRDNAELDRVVSEVRVLQHLIEQLSTSRSKQAKPAATETDAAAADAKPQAQSGEAPNSAVPSQHGAGSEDLGEDEVLDIVREGLRRERVDLYLQPIVGLPQRKPYYYECFSRIRAADGTVISPDQYMDIAKQEGLIGAIDNMLLFRCVQLVRRLQDRRPNVGFFCNISANTLQDRDFFSDFVEFMGAHQELAKNIIFEFSQEDLETHRREIGEYATRLGPIGFHFSLDQVEDLQALNLEVLSALGFRFIKIDSDVLLRFAAAAEAPAMAGTRSEGAADGEDLALAEETVVGVDVGALKRAMDLHNIDLIVSKFEEEEKLVELLDFRIDFGQGFLFGEPRLSKLN